MTTALLDTLRQIVGAAHVLTHEDPATDLTAYEQDWRKRATGHALAVVRPASTAEVAAVLNRSTSTTTMTSAGCSRSRPSIPQSNRTW